MKTNKDILMNFISTQGYKRNSPDVNNPMNVIPSGNITMKDVDFPVHGVDNLGNEQMMMPGGEYVFPGNYVIETPAIEEDGGMIKRADGSYSKRGMWDNIRANAGSGKKPTKEMLEQEARIRNQEMEFGGNYMYPGYYMTTPEMQEGGEQMQMQMPQQQTAQPGGVPDISAALGEISRMIEQGDDPSEIYGMLLENGVADEQAQAIIQEAMSALEESDMEEEDVPMDSEEMGEYQGFQNTENEEEESVKEEEDIDPAEMKRGGSIKIKESKKGTFKAQATKMGMSVSEAAEYILRHKEDFSPAMVKKANFAKNFAKELGGEIYDLKQYGEGGGIPDRYKNMGFTKVGAKRKSTRPGKKWMVLAKKGDQYKVIHGGWKGMKDYTQHHSKQRRENFWSRMGGRDSSKAKDPFSPLYWHKRFGTWQEGGELFDYENPQPGDFRTDVTTSNTLSNLKDSKFNKTLGAINSLADPRNMMWALPNTGLLGKIKGAAGLAAGVSGAVLGYEKMFAKPKTQSYLENSITGEEGTLEDVLAGRKPPIKSTPIPRQGIISDGSGMGNMYMQEQQNEFMGLEGYEMGGTVKLKKYQSGGSSSSVQLTAAQEFYAEEMYKKYGKFILTDVATNKTLYGTKDANGNWQVREFEVLTGKGNANTNNYNFFKPDATVESLANNSRGRVTPLGVWDLQNGYAYGYNSLSIESPGKPSPSISYHKTYYGPDDTKRATYYNNQNPADNYTSYGCINCQKGDLKDLMSFKGNMSIPSVIMDSRLSFDEMNKYMKKNTPQGAILMDNTTDRSSQIKQITPFATPSVQNSLEQITPVAKIESPIFASRFDRNKNQLINVNKNENDNLTTSFNAAPVISQPPVAQVVQAPVSTTFVNSNTSNNQQVDMSKPFLFDWSKNEYVNPGNMFKSSVQKTPEPIALTTPVAPVTQPVQPVQSTPPVTPVVTATPVSNATPVVAAAPVTPVVTPSTSTVNITSVPPTIASNMPRTGGSGIGSMEYLESQNDILNTPSDYSSDTTKTEPNQIKIDTWKSKVYGDPAGQIVANNALSGFGMANTVLSTTNQQKEYQKLLRKIGNTDQRYNAYNPANPFGNYTLNAGPASNFALVTNTPAQDFGTRMSGAKYGGTFQEGGEYYVSDKELKMILAMGGEIEFLE